MACSDRFVPAVFMRLLQYALIFPAELDDVVYFQTILFCCSFISISIFLLPLSMIVHCLIYTYFCPLTAFANSCSRSIKIFHWIWQLSSFLVLYIRTACSCDTSRKKLILSFHAHTKCMLLYIHYTQWVTFIYILLSGVIEKIPGPNCGIFKFCTWNPNSIVA